MMKKFLKSLTLLSLVVTLAIPANAGVVKQLVEVDPQQQKIEEEQVRQAQEAYQQEAQQQEQQIIEKAKRILDEQIEDVPLPEPEVAVREEPAKVADSGHGTCFICKPVGVLTGVLVSPIAGLFRGAVSKGGSYANSFDDALGDGFFGNVIGFPIGAITGGVTGAITGLGNGLLTGLVKGYQNPFSSSSYTLGEGDYDPYDFIGGGQ